MHVSPPQASYLSINLESLVCFSSAPKVKRKRVLSFFSHYDAFPVARRMMCQSIRPEGGLGACCAMCVFVLFVFTQGSIEYE